MGWFSRGCLGAVLLLAIGCASAPPEPERFQWSATDLAYVRSPLEGTPTELAPDVEAQIGSAYRALREGDPEPAERVGRGLSGLLEDSSVPRTLRAQAWLLAGEYARVVESLEPIVRSAPDYGPARVALGRAYDLLGERIAAWRTFSPLVERPAAETLGAGPIRQRVAELVPEVIPLLAVRVEDSLARNEIDPAREAFDWLRELDPDGAGTYRAALALAAAEGDAPGELAALRALVARGELPGELRRRLADLELEFGEPGEALKIYEGLIDENPGDSELLAQLDRAKFRWRLRLMPRTVVELSQLPVLSRGDFAALAYWLVPSVRRGAPIRATIANDILDHRMREEIVRVINLELMDVDPVHRFYPDRPVRTLTVLRTFVELLARSGGDSSCAGEGWARGLEADAVCARAVECKLLASVSDCRPFAEVSGVRAVEIGRAAIEQLRSP